MSNSPMVHKKTKKCHAKLSTNMIFRAQIRKFMVFKSLDVTPLEKLLIKY